MVPASYAQWRQFIQVRCGIRLAPRFINQRLQELQDDRHQKTQEFARVYGVDQLHRTIAWFRQASDELAANGGRDHDV